MSNWFHVQLVLRVPYCVPIVYDPSDASVITPIILRCPKEFISSGLSLWTTTLSPTFAEQNILAADTSMRSCNLSWHLWFRLWLYLFAWLNLWSRTYCIMQSKSIPFFASSSTTWMTPFHHVQYWATLISKLHTTQFKLNSREVRSKILVPLDEEYHPNKSPWEALGGQDCQSNNCWSGYLQ